MKISDSHLAPVHPFWSKSTFEPLVDVGVTWPGPASTSSYPSPPHCLPASHPAVHHCLSCRAHPRSGSVQTSPTSTPMSGRRGRQLPQLPPMGKDRSKCCICPILIAETHIFYVYPTWEKFDKRSSVWGEIKIFGLTSKLHISIEAEGNDCSLPRGTPSYCRLWASWWHWCSLFALLLFTPLLLPRLFLSQKTETKEQSLVKVCTWVSEFSLSETGLLTDAHSALKDSNPGRNSGQAESRAPAHWLSCPVPLCSHL